MVNPDSLVQVSIRYERSSKRANVGKLTEGIGGDKNGWFHDGAVIEPAK